jgi:ElaB/YqjD/DUF883 family membrane-anchored ribosome-binding protein
MSELEFYSKEQLVTLNNAVKESVDSLIRGEAEADFRKDVAARMEEELKMKKADFNALVKERFNEKSTKVLQKAQEIVDLNEELVSAARNLNK